MRIFSVAFVAFVLGGIFLFFLLWLWFWFEQNSSSGRYGDSSQYQSGYSSQSQNGYDNGQNGYGNGYGNNTGQVYPYYRVRSGVIPAIDIAAESHGLY
jgi:hypothetical protein